MDREQTWREHFENVNAQLNRKQVECDDLTVRAVAAEAALGAFVSARFTLAGRELGYVEEQDRIEELKAERDEVLGYVEEQDRHALVLEAEVARLREVLGKVDSWASSWYGEGEVERIGVLKKIHNIARAALGEDA